MLGASFGWLHTAGRRAGGHGTKIRAGTQNAQARRTKPGSRQQPEPGCEPEGEDGAEGAGTSECAHSATLLMRAPEATGRRARGERNHRAKHESD